MSDLTREVLAASYSKNRAPSRQRLADSVIEEIEAAGLKVIVPPDVDALVEVAARALYEHDEASSCGAPDCVHAKWESLPDRELAFLQDQYRQDVRPVVLAVLAAVVG
jgi:hypothetical protein